MQVRGIGACGFYRLPRTPAEEAAEIEAEKKEAEKKEEERIRKEKNKALPDGEEGEVSDVTSALYYLYYMCIYIYTGIRLFVYLVIMYH